MTETFERGVVVVSIDTEQIWGYLDCMTETQFQARFPDSPEAHPKLLARLCAADVRATWFVVGGLALRQSACAAVRRIAGHPVQRAHPPCGGEDEAPLWYCRPFLELLGRALPAQEIGLHGGLTHLVWTCARSSREVARLELTEGIEALAQMGLQPQSFSYPRDQEAYLELLPAHGLQCFRGSTPALAWRLGRTLPGALLRAWEELRRTPPPVVWPEETLPGLWKIPASMFLYPIVPSRARLIGLGSRVERFRLGLEAAARQRAIFHFCFHPENLVESPLGFALLDDMLEMLVRARDRGDVEVLTMRDVAARMERKQDYELQRQRQYPDLLEAHRCQQPAAANQPLRSGL
jgi:hypothetical protein